MAEDLPKGYRWDNNGRDNGQVTSWWVVRESDGKIIHWVERRGSYYEVIWARGFPHDSYDTQEHAQEVVCKRVAARAAGGVVAGDTEKQ